MNEVEAVKAAIANTTDSDGDRMDAWYTDSELHAVALAAIAALDAARGDRVARKDRPMNTENWTFRLGDRVTKTKGSSWTGLVVGFYSTTLTPEGYAVESESERGSVQIYPVGALARRS